MKKNTNTNKNFNILTELRNKQIREIEDYDRNMDKRVYALEQLEYEDIYPDDNTIVGNIKLPPEVAYRYFVNASKFYSSIIYFTSEISNLGPESDEFPNINSLKWSDFFESYGAFRAQITTFLKIPENFKDAEILKYFDNIVKALESFFSAIELYDDSYDDDYPLMDNYRQQLLEMYSFIESS